MRDLFKLLKTSVLILALVVCVYLAGEAYSSSIDGKNTPTSSQTRTNEAVANLGDVLATVEQEQATGGGSEK